MMYQYFQPSFGSGSFTFFPMLGSTILILALWSIFWKGLALWHSAERRQPWWFVAFLFINTAGLLEIFYLFFMLKLKFNQLFSK